MMVRDKTLDTKYLGFTLIELLAVLVVLSVILAIAIPAVTGIVRKAAKAAFESDAKLVLKAMDYQKLVDDTFNPVSINRDTVVGILKLSNEHYEKVSVIVENTIPIITIIGQGKWDGFVACGTYKKMEVFESTTDCSYDLIPPVITILGDNPASIFVGDTYEDAGATALDDKDGDITDNIQTTGTVNPSVPGSYTITYEVSDSAGNNATPAVRTVNVIDNEGPTITFNPNGYATYAKDRSIEVTVEDVGTIIAGSLKYVWTTSTDEPPIGDFISSFTSGSSINSPTSVTGSYYLWITASDDNGNTTAEHSNVVNLDNTGPNVASVTSSASNVTTSGFTINRSGNASDEHSGLDTNPYIYQTSTDNNNWTTKCTNNTTSCAVTGLAEDTDYYYRICANDVLSNQSCVASKTVKTEKIIVAKVLSSYNICSHETGDGCSDGGLHGGPTPPPTNKVYMYSVNGTTVQTGSSVPANARWVILYSYRLCSYAVGDYCGETSPYNQTYMYSVDGTTVQTGSSVPANARWAALKNYSICSHTYGDNCYATSLYSQVYMYSVDGTTVLTGSNVPANAKWATLSTYSMCSFAIADNCGGTSSYNPIYTEYNLN